MATIEYDGWWQWVTCLCWVREHSKDPKITCQEVCFRLQGQRALKTVLSRLFHPRNWGGTLHMLPLIYYKKPTNWCWRRSVIGFLCLCHTQVTWSCDVHASYICHWQRRAVRNCHRHLAFFDGRHFLMDDSMVGGILSRFICSPTIALCKAGWALFPDISSLRCWYLMLRREGVLGTLLFLPSNSLWWSSLHFLSAGYCAALAAYNLPGWHDLPVTRGPSSARCQSGGGGQFMVV